MATGYWLLDNPNPFYKQYRETRRTYLPSGLPAHGGQLTGGIILHSAEGGTDLVGPDMTAENVANFIDSRTNAGSYHRICDRDSRVKMAPLEYEVWHDTTSNPYTIGLSVAWNKADLGRMTKAQREEYYKNFAADVLEAIAYLKTKGITVPLDRYRTREEIMAGKPGISTHSRMDPSRRTDPFGTGSSYEAEFLAYLQKAAGSVNTSTPTSEEDDMNEILFFAHDKDGTKHRYGTLGPAHYTHVRDENNYSNGRNQIGHVVKKWENRANDETIGEPWIFGQYVGPDALRPQGA